jgi:hypothetical protein
MLFLIADPAAVNGERVGIALGFLALGLGVAVFASCRSFVGLLERLGIKDPAGSRGYRAFNKFHMFYWWSFGVAVLAHLMMTTFHTGLPRPGDPDAGVHLTILMLGLASGLSSATLFFSCRISQRVLAPTMPGLSVSNRTYRSFFARHSYYWLVFGLFLAAHLVASYLHVGLWPAAG